MGLTYNSAQVYMLVGEIASFAGKIDKSTSAINKEAQKLAGTSNIQGQKWINIVAYLETVYTAVSTLISAASALLDKGCRDYYYQFGTFEGAVDAIIDTKEIAQIGAQGAYLSSIQAAYETYSGSVKTTVQSVNDISKQRYNGMGDFVSIIGALEKHIQSTITNVENAEASATDVLSEIKSLLDNAKAMIKAQKGITSSKGIENFSTKDFVKSQIFQDASKSFDSALTLIEKYEQNADNANAFIEGVSQEWEDRQRTAQAAKTVWAIAGLVVGVAAAVFIPGAGAVVVGVAMGAMSGALNEGLNQWSDVGQAAKGGIDTGSIINAAVWGGIKGGFSAWAGGAFGKASEGLKGASKLGLKVLEEVTKDVAIDALDAGEKLTKAAITGDSELLMETAEEYGSASHWGERVLKSTVQGAIGYGVGEIKIKTNNKGTAKVIEKTIEGAIKKPVKKTAEWLTDSTIESVVEGKNWGQTIIDNAPDGKTVLQWSVEGALENGIPEAYSQTDQFTQNAREYAPHDKGRLPNAAKNQEKREIKSVVKSATGILDWSDIEDQSLKPNEGLKSEDYQGRSLEDVAMDATKAGANISAPVGAETTGSIETKFSPPSMNGWSIGECIRTGPTIPMGGSHITCRGFSFGNVMPEGAGAGGGGGW